MKNKYQHNEDGTTFIFVESKNKHFPGKHTIVIDTEDWDKVKEHTWSIKAGPRDRTPYAKTKILNPDGGWLYYTRQGKEERQRRMTTLLLHHAITGKPQKGMVVDHVSHSGLDNRKENLRLVTSSQNSQNRRSNRNSSRS